MNSNPSKPAKNLSVFSDMETLEHEQIVFCNDNPTRLKAIIAIHSTVLGPSLGGTRMWSYNNEQEAITDALRLSRGMTYKAAVTGLNIGGGKAVLIGDARTMKTEAYLRRFGKFINGLDGRYVTAEDVNMKTCDMEYIAMETEHVTGLPQSRGGSGDPSPVTAYGTWVGMKAMMKKLTGNDSLEGKKVLVQGAGQVGMYLANHLKKENAKIIVSDIDDEKVRKVVADTGASVVSPDEIFEQVFDVYSPCALGATLNDNTIPKLSCSIVAGAANNQLLDEDRHGEQLQKMNILYAPDFVINAGGLISVYLEHLKEYSSERAYSMAENIYQNCEKVIKKAEEDGTAPQRAAVNIAESRIREIGNVKLSL